MSEQDRAFLDLFPANTRSHVANLFLRPVREGRSTPTAVHAAVCAELRARAEGRVWDRESWQRDCFVLAMVRDHYDEALAYARWCIEYERLPPEEKKRRKQASAAEGIGRWQEQQPATEKQIAYLRALGYAGPVESRRHASALIDVYARGGRVEVDGVA